MRREIRLKKVVGNLKNCNVAIFERAHFFRDILILNLNSKFKKNSMIKKDLLKLASFFKLSSNILFVCDQQESTTTTITPVRIIMVE